MKNLDGGFEVKNFSYSLFKGNYCMESKVTEYGIIFLHTYKVEHSPDYHSLFYSKIKRTFCQIEHLHFLYTFSCFIHIYMTSLGNIHLQSHFESKQSTQSKCR